MNSQLTLYLIYFLAFFALLALADGLYSVVADLNVKRRLKVMQRLRSLSPAAPSASPVGVSLLREPRLSDIPALNRLLLQLPLLRQWDATLEQAGVGFTVARYLLLQLLLGGLVFGLLCAFTPGPPLFLLLLAMAAGFFLPRFYIRRKRAQRITRFGELLPDTMDYIARSMRAGNPFTASLKSAAAQMPEPIASELRITFEEMNFGVDLEQALRHLGERSGSEELRYFITAVLIQRTTGGNLAEVLTRIASVMRSRAAMSREIQAISAEMNYSSKVLIALPFLMALIISVENPGYMQVLLEHRIGIAMIAAQCIFMLMGWYVIRQMINFRV
jgi:tight adherence protein B